MSDRYRPPPERIQIMLDPDVIELLRDIITGKTSATTDELALLRAGITQLRQEIRMSGTLDQEIQTLTTQVQSNTDATAAAVAAISGIPAMIQTAVDAALAAGATPAQLQAITDLGNTIASNASSLGAAVTANTQAPAPTPTPAPAPATDPASAPAVDPGATV